MDIEEYKAHTTSGYPEPLFDLEVAQRFVLFGTLPVFKNWLRRHPEIPRRYRLWAHGRKRVLTGSDVKYIQATRDMEAHRRYAKTDLARTAQR